MISHSNTLCSRLWNYPVVDLAKIKVRVCCKTPSIQLSHEDIAKYGDNVFVNLDVFKDDRKLMLEGGKPQRCDSCWNLEDQGIHSFRDGPDRWNRYFANIDYEDNTESNHPNDLDIQLDNYCDLKCIYCNEEFSSQWQTEKEKYGDIKKYIPIHTDSDKFTELFFSWFDKVKHNFGRIAFLGGEPLISPRFYELLDRVIDSYNNDFPKDLKIYIITNLNTKEKFLDRFCDTIEKYKNKIKFIINVSMESTGEQAEFIRAGLDYERFVRNFNRIAAIQGIRIINITTINLLCLSTLSKHLEFILELEKNYNIYIDIHGNIVTWPEHLQIGLMDRALGKKYIEECVSLLKNKNHNTYIDFLNSLENSFQFDELKGTEKHNKFKTELDTLSTRRLCNYKEIFKNYEYIWS